MRTKSPSSPWRPAGAGLQWLAPLVLVLLTVLPYHRLVRLESIVITDDVFASDIANWEFPLRAAVGEQLRSGESISWLPGVCGGYPALAGTGTADPLSLALFSVLSPTAAINFLLVGLLVVAALGAYAYARRLGASRSAAVLAGLSYAYSGYMVTQLRRVAAASIAAWLPLGLLLVDYITAEEESKVSGLPKKVLASVGLAMVFGLQALAGFPQIAFYSALVYFGAATWRSAGSCIRHRGGEWRSALAAWLLVGFALAAGAGIGAPSLLPMHELGQTSDRVGGLSWEEATHIVYWPPNALNFLIPYVHGDASDLSYHGPSLFWEDYGYLGLLPFLLAVGVLLPMRRDPRVQAHALLALLAFAYVLGPATPLFRWSFDHLPGMNLFRIPNRMLFVVTLALVILASLGLTALQKWFSGPGGERRRRSAVLGLVVIAITYVDLVHHQMRQNAFVDADQWMRPPDTLERLESSEMGATPPGRVASLKVRREHMKVFSQVGGWSGDLQPYVDLRDLLQPNMNLHWGVSSLGCYMSILPRWIVNTLGDRSRSGLLDLLLQEQEGRLVAGPGLARLLRILGTEFVVTGLELDAPGFEAIGSCDSACVYRVVDALPRAWVVPRGLREVGPPNVDYLLGPDFDPRVEVLLHDTTDSVLGEGASALAGSARIRSYGATEIEITAEAPGGGYLVLADSWYPGWEVEVDGQPETILRANLMTRAVRLSPGQHEVRFHYESASVRLGIRVAASTTLILLSVSWLALRRRRVA